MAIPPSDSGDNHADVTTSAHTANRHRETDHPSFDHTTGEVSGAWVLDRTPDPDPGIMPHIMVADVEVAVEAVLAAGGEIVLAPGEYDTDAIATFLDPAGNLLGIYQQPGLQEATGL